MPDGLNRPDRPVECPECNCRILAPMGNGRYRCTNKACWIVFEWPKPVEPIAANDPQSLQDSITGPSKASDEVSSVPDKRTPHIESDNPVYLELRRIYCCKGAEFCRPTLEKAWKEIARLERLVIDNIW